MSKRETKPTHISSKKREPRSMLRNRYFIIGFALYLTFILLSMIPYIAESHVRSRTDDMDDDINYHLIFKYDGDQTHYYCEREDTEKNAEIDLDYTTPTHTLNVKTTNIKVLTVDCKKVFWDECEDVYKISPYTDEDYYKTYFIDKDKFIINVESDTKIEKLNFKYFPKPVEVWVGNEKLEEGTDYTFSGDSMGFVEVPKGKTEVILFFKEKLPPVAKFTMSGTYESADKTKIFGVAGEEITFDAKDSNDPDGGTIDDFSWDLGDETTKSGINAKHTYNTVGEYTVKLTVTDNYGLEGELSKTLTIVEKLDTDEDGMPDAWETEYNLNINQDDARIDTDKDGLKNIEEYFNGTNPKDKDSDDDGYTDGDEVKKHKTDPTNPKSKPEKDSGEEGLGAFTMILIVAAIVLVVIILIVVMLIIKRKKKATAEPTERVIDGAEPEGPPSQIPIETPPAMPDQPAGEQYPMYPESYEQMPQEFPEPIPPMPMESYAEEEPTEAPEPEDLSLEEGPAIDEELPPDEEVPEEDAVPSDDSLEEGLDEGLDEEGLLDLDGKDLLDEEAGLEGEGLPEPEETPEDEALPGEEEPVPEPEPKEPEGETKADEKKMIKKKPKMEPEAGAKEEFTVKDFVKSGAIHFKNNEYTDAIIEWQKALDLEPDHPEIIASIKEAMAKLQEK